MIGRRGISPFIATVLLVAMTISLGGILYTSFRDTVASQIRNPSLSLLDTSLAGDRQTITAIVKNDGNVDLSVSRFVLTYSSVIRNFVLGNNATVLSGSPQMKPGTLLTIKFRLSDLTLPSLAPFTITVVADQLARAFNVLG